MIVFPICKPGPYDARVCEEHAYLLISSHDSLNKEKTLMFWLKRGMNCSMARAPGESYLNLFYMEGKLVTSNDYASLQIRLMGITNEWRCIDCSKQITSWFIIQLLSKSREQNICNDWTKTCIISLKIKIIALHSTNWPQNLSSVRAYVRISELH